MNQLHQTAVNFFAVPSPDGTPIPIVELILISSEKHYEWSGGEKLKPVPLLKTDRYIVSRNTMLDLANALKGYAEELDSSFILKDPEPKAPESEGKQ